MKIFKVFITLISLNLIIQSAHAEEIAIADTSGVIRSVSDLQSSAVVRFTVTDQNGKPVDGAVVNLNSKDGLVKLQGIVTGGEVEFQGIAAGQWVVSTENSKLLFTQISITEFTGGAAVAGASGGAVVTTTGATAGLTTGTIVTGGLLAAGGITGLAIAVDNSNSNSKTEMSPIS